LELVRNAQHQASIQGELRLTGRGAQPQERFRRVGMRCHALQIQAFITGVEPLASDFIGLTYFSSGINHPKRFGRRR